MTEAIWQLSQNHLHLLSTCPRKFQYTYLEQFTSPCIPQRQNNLNLGNRFHRLMQQRELDLPVESILATDKRLATSFQALAAAAPQVVFPQPKTWRQAEHRRTFLKGNFLLIGIYDLLILSEDKAEIIDWKTYAQPPHSEILAKHWQTRLYKYLLAETSDYSPEQIQFTYWFIHLPQQPTAVTFSYNRSEHAKTEKELNQLLAQLNDYYQQYKKNKTSFPQVELEKGDCLECPFKRPCQRQSKSAEISFSEVEEQSI
ncbi:MAG: PD-(D/E)XK nuclease family protein [Cyanobacteria bacterium]|jgi:hypothetical protein|nr:PD-(D/E)XK nuclease family protein [Cyanobacteria bacterium GSL.Bin1]